MSRTFGRLVWDRYFRQASLQDTWFAAQQAFIAQPSVNHTERYAHLVAKLNELANLADNWDGYGGAAISQSTLDHVRKLLGAQVLYGRDLSLPDLMPTSNGTIALEWQEPDGEAIVEIGENDLSGFVRTREDEHVVLGGSASDFSESIPSIVDAYISIDHEVPTTISQVEYDLAGND